MSAPRIDVEERDRVRVVRFRDRKITDERLVREIGDQLFAVAPADGPIYMVIDFSGIDLLSSSFLGRLILLQRRVDASGGGMRFCEMTAVTESVFKNASLHRIFGIDRDLREALEKLQAKP